MDVLTHLVYEIEKGVRPLALYTAAASDRSRVVAYLERKGLAFHVHSICKRKINVFLGSPECIETVCNFSSLHTWLAFLPSVPC